MINVDPLETVIIDSGYENDRCLLNRHLQTARDHMILQSVFAKHENLNGRLNEFRIFDQKFRHNWSLHSYYFHFVPSILHISVNHENPSRKILWRRHFTSLNFYSNVFFLTLTIHLSFSLWWLFNWYQTIFGYFPSLKMHHSQFPPLVVLSYSPSSTGNVNPIATFKSCEDHVIQNFCPSTKL